MTHTQHKSHILHGVLTATSEINCVHIPGNHVSFNLDHEFATPPRLRSRSTATPPTLSPTSTTSFVTSTTGSAKVTTNPVSILDKVRKRRYKSSNDLAESDSKSTTGLATTHLEGVLKKPSDQFKTSTNGTTPGSNSGSTTYPEGVLKRPRAPPLRSRHISLVVDPGSPVAGGLSGLSEEAESEGSEVGFSK